MRRVLVPLDGSAFAESALPYAVHVARRAGASIELVGVHTPAITVPSGRWSSPEDVPRDEERDELEQYLAVTAGRVRQQHGGLAIEPLVLDGTPAPTIAEHAERGGADLIVLTSHGRGGLSRYWLGSVTDHLVRRLHIPLLVVRPTSATPAALAPDAPHRVLVPLDETRASERGIDAALAVVGAEGVHYTLLRVIAPPPRAARMVVSAAEVEQRAERERAQAEAALGEVAERMRARGLDVDVVVRLDVQPGEEIVRHVEEVGTDLIALATHGHGALGRVLLGSVADKVLRTAPVPVLVFHVPPQDEQARPDDQSPSGSE